MCSLAWVWVIKSLNNTGNNKQYSISVVQSDAVGVVEEEKEEEDAYKE